MVTVLAILSAPLFCFLFNDTAPPEIYTLSLHDALPIFLYQIVGARQSARRFAPPGMMVDVEGQHLHLDRKSTRLNSSHVSISYAVFCLKKKNQQNMNGLDPAGMMVPGRVSVLDVSVAND